MRADSDCLVSGGRTRFHHRRIHFVNSKHMELAHSHSHTISPWVHPLILTLSLSHSFFTLPPSLLLTRISLLLRNIQPFISIMGEWVAQTVRLYMCVGKCAPDQWVTKTGHFSFFVVTVISCTKIANHEPFQTFCYTICQKKKKNENKNNNNNHEQHHIGGKTTTTSTT